MSSEKKHRQIFLAWLLVNALLPLIHPGQASGEITADDYCQITIALANNTIDDLSERLALFTQYSSDFRLFLIKEKELIEKNQEKRKALFAGYDLTPGQYGMFKRTHKQETDFYLREHPEVREEIESLSAQISSLIESYESLKQNAGDIYLR